MTVTAYETRTFVFNKPPTGGEIYALIAEHDLYDYNLQAVELKHTQPVSGLSTLNPYRYEVSFRRNNK